MLAAAERLDIPELGVRIPDLPARATALKVVDKLVGYSASFRVGRVHAGVLWLSDPVPTEATVTDRRYRRSVRDYLFDNIHHGGHEEATSIAGVDAWSNCGAESFGGPDVQWHCTYYLISDQHLYRLLVNATSPKKPAEFDAVVRALYGMSFGPIQSPIGSDGQPRTMPREPLFKAEQMAHEWYPDRARNHREEGVVDVEYSIDGRGRPQDLRVTSAASADLRSAAADFVRMVIFRVPSGWESSTSRGLRFTFEAQFSIAPCHFPGDPRVADATLVTICASGPR
ncbi:MAG TPA: energy transducer TonB [Steroidobacteraceae bacterium]|nr:energy transducer TonB [Steroidobacteraceae bacterium]